MVEEEEIDSRLVQLNNAMDMNAQDLLSTLRDYTNWNDTYDYTYDLNRDFIDVNFVDTTFISLIINTVVISGLNGSIFFEKTYNDSSMSDQPTDPQLLGHLMTGGELLDRVLITKEWSGFAYYSEHLVWVACRQVYDSDGGGDPVGIMTFVKWVTPITMNRIERITTYNLNIDHFDAAKLQLAMGEDNFRDLTTFNKVVNYESLNSSTLFLIKRDVNGNPVMVVSSQYERDINVERSATLQNYLLYFIMMSAIILIIIMLLLERFVIARMIQFDKDVDSISEDKGGQRRLHVDGGDEIATLAASINDMLRNIEDAQTSMVESERRYRAIVQDQTEHIFRFNIGRRLTFANDSFMKYYALDEVGMEGLAVSRNILNEDKIKFDLAIEELIKTQSSICMELRCIDSAKAIRWQHWTISMIRDYEDLAGSEFQVVARDVTEEKAADEELRHYRNSLEEIVQERTKELMTVNEVLEKEIEKRRKVETDLQESQRQYKAVVEDQTELIARITPDGKIRFANNAFLRYYDLDLSLEEDRVFMPNIVSEDQKNYSIFLSSLSRDRPSGMTEYRVIRGDEERWQQWTYRLIFDVNGNMTEIQGVGRDITDRKRLEEELIRSEHLESLGMLAGGIAHEFNNTLTKVLGNITLAKSMVPSADPLHRRLESTEREIYEAKRLTDNILTFSDGGEPIKQVTNVEALIRDAGEAATAGSAVKMHCTLPEDLWSVDGDPSQLLHVFRSVISNAVDAMPHGGVVKIAGYNHLVDKDVDLVDLQNGRYVKIDVIDHGDGISKENLQHIFDPYYSTKGKGGLGLPTAMSVIKRHNGTILVETAVNVGSKFSIFLPAAERKEVVAQAVPQVTSKKDLRILLMDDEEGILEVGSELLGEFGYKVECARTGEEAIRAYSTAYNEGRRFDLIIMDLTIKGGMGGKDAIKRIKELDPSAKAIVSSGYSHDPVMAKPKEYGFSGVVKKPYMIHEMLQEIKRVLSE
jgi:PAS domain S-box-containing protein